MPRRPTCHVFLGTNGTLRRSDCLLAPSAVASPPLRKAGRQPILEDPPMRHRPSAFPWCILVLGLSQAIVPHSAAADDKDQVLFNFEGESAAKDWAAVRLPEGEAQQPAPTVQIVPSPQAKAAGEGQQGKCLK